VLRFLDEFYFTWVVIPGKLQRIHGKDQTSALQEILYSHNHSKRSGKCFLFMLEDKTMSLGTSGSGTLGDDESGLGTGRLYGICVVHPRVLSAVIDQTPQSSGGDTTAATSPTASTSNTKLSYEFESMVCYAFITRFPLFEFFFQGKINFISLLQTPLDAACIFSLV
jgi:hypothetical protein